MTGQPDLEREPPQDGIWENTDAHESKTRKYVVVEVKQLQVFTQKGNVRRKFESCIDSRFVYGE